MTESEMALAIMEFIMMSIEVKQITISWMLVLAKSFWIVEISIIVRSDLLFRKSEHSRYPKRLRAKFLFWVKLMAYIWQKDAECPNISTYMATIRYYFILRAGNPFSLRRGLSVLSSFRIILSSSCFDLVYPMLLISSCNSLDKFEAELLISGILITIIDILLFN